MPLSPPRRDSLNKKPEAKTHRIQIGGSVQQPQSIEAGGAQQE
jgi:hypothetical protein